uniref:Uncharacterized protein LOC104228936 n=1 Tax=Nicotiana sylvestris TaxID=4096 RepID=A0A1U7WIM6_NICSY|nr:PREDICTED: uncharacterized protein LOC104228936 [Nicotiana sylvestris]
MQVLNVYAVDECEESVCVPNIVNHIEAYISQVLVGTDDSSSEDEDEDEDEDQAGSDGLAYDSEELEQFEAQRNVHPRENLNEYKEIYKGISFKDIPEARKSMNLYSLVNQKKLKLLKSDKIRVRYKCVVGYPFKCLISIEKGNEGCRVKTLNPIHDCNPAFDNSRVEYNTIAYYFKKKLQDNPKYKVKAMRADLKNSFQLNASKSKVKRAKRMIFEKLEGSFTDDYNKLEAYANALRDSNLGSDVVINLSKEVLLQGKRKFLRMYIYFHALKMGYKESLRPFIGVDGTFLKGKAKGQLLVAVRQDNMNHFYPLAWAVVDRETKRSWTWFLELLHNSLDLNMGNGVIFMLDMQKGLMEAIKTYFLKQNIEDFKDQLSKLGQLKEATVTDLLKYPPQSWCRAYFDTVCKNQGVDNNFTESFNSWILEARYKPIIKMLEDIRLKVMNQLRKHEDEVRTWKTKYSPQSMKLYTDYLKIAHSIEVDFNGDDGFEIVEGEDPLKEMHWWYSKEAFLLTYKHKLQLVPAEKFWKLDPSQAMEPPELVKQAGRPKVKRDRQKDEAIKRQGE